MGCVQATYLPTCLGSCVTQYSFVVVGQWVLGNGCRGVNPLRAWGGGRPPPLPRIKRWGESNVLHPKQSKNLCTNIPIPIYPHYFFCIMEHTCFLPVLNTALYIFAPPPLPGGKSMPLHVCKAFLLLWTTGEETLVL